MKFFQLKRLYDFSLRALENPSAYLKGVPGDTTLYRCACCRKSSLPSSLEHRRAILRAETASAEPVHDFCRGEGTDITPFADMLPLTQRPAVRPLPPREKLQEALVLRPGRASLREASSCEHAAMTVYTCTRCEHGLHMRRLPLLRCENTGAAC